MPKLAAKARAINSGSVRSRRSGAKRYHTIKRAISPRVIRKSTKLVMTEPAGTMRRGKYILEIRLALPIRLLLDSLRAVEKNCQGSIAAMTSSAYGAAPGAGSLAILLKTTVKTTVVSKGRI